MFHPLRFSVAIVALALLVCPLPCEAYVRWLKLPLTAHRGHAGAKGMVTFSESFGETDAGDGATLVIEVSNVPLPPGTELIVEVHEKQVGSLKLDPKRGGRLVLKTTANKSVPRIHTGSMVTLRVPGGGTVLW